MASRYVAVSKERAAQRETLKGYEQFCQLLSIPRTAHARKRFAEHPRTEGLENAGIIRLSGPQEKARAALAEPRAGEPLELRRLLESVALVPDLGEKPARAGGDE